MLAILRSWHPLEESRHAAASAVALQLVAPHAAPSRAGHGSLRARRTGIQHRLREHGCCDESRFGRQGHQPRVKHDSVVSAFSPGREEGEVVASAASASWQSFAQPEKLLCAGEEIGHGVLPVDDDGDWRVGGPDRRSKVGRGLESESGRTVGPDKRNSW